MKTTLIAILSLISILSFGQKLLPKVQVEQLKQISADEFSTVTPFIEHIYSYLCMNFDSVGSKLNVQYSKEIEGICSFHQKFEDIYYELNACKLPKKSEVIVRFKNYSIASVQNLVEQIVKTYDIDAVPFIWNEARTKYYADIKGINFYFELTSNAQSITLKRCFEY